MTDDDLLREASDPTTPGERLQFFRVSVKTSVGSDSVSVTYFHLPILLGLNLNETFSIMATPGIVYALSSSNLKGPSGDDRSSYSSVGGVMARIGLGLNIRPTAGFALQPEVTYMRAFSEGSVSFLMLGLGFNFGSLPMF